MLLSHLVARCQIFLLMNKTALPLAVNKLLFQLWQDSIPGLLIARWTVDHCVIGLRLAKVWQQSCWSADHFFWQRHLCMKSTGLFETFAREKPASLVFLVRRWFIETATHRTGSTLFSRWTKFSNAPLHLPQSFHQTWSLCPSFWTTFLQLF